MGGECYRYCRLAPTATITEKEDKIYLELLTTLIPEIKSWLEEEEQDPNDWIATFDDDGGCSLQVKDQKYFEGKIILPKQLDRSLDVGWQHRRYGSIKDPKKPIATKIMDALMESVLRTLIEELEEDNTRDSDEDYQESKGLFHMSYMDNHWSPNGLYGGYDDWETYQDAHGDWETYQDAHGHW